MLSRWLSPRSLMLHVAVLAWVAGCLLAASWQVGRAEQGNTFSYLYSIEWPALAVVGVWCWWLQLRSTRSQRAARATSRQASERRALVAFHSRRDRAEEGSELAAYNDYLERLAAVDERGGR